MSSFANARPKILVVDDDAGVVRVIVEMLGDHIGFQPLTACSGCEALGVLHAHPDLAAMTTDVNMPNGGGVELVKAARKMNFRGPIVVVSSVANDVKPVLKDHEPIEFLDKLLVSDLLVSKLEILSPDFAALRAEFHRLKAQVAESIVRSTLLVDETREAVEQTREQIERTRLLLKR